MGFCGRGVLVEVALAFAAAALLPTLRVAVASTVPPRVGDASAVGSVVASEVDTKVGGTSVGGTAVGGTSVGGTAVGCASEVDTEVGGTSVGGTAVGGTSVGGTAVGGTSVGGTAVGGTAVGGGGGTSVGGGGGTSVGGGGGGLVGCSTTAVGVFAAVPNRLAPLPNITTAAANMTKTIAAMMIVCRFRPRPCIDKAPVFVPCLLHTL
jgi:hypothetical protein